MTRRNIWRRVLSVALVCMLLFGSGAVGVVPAGAVDIPAGYTPIYTAEQLNNVRNNLGGKYILMNDIDISSLGNWVPIGSSYENAFTGVLDGNGYKITGINILSTALTNRQFNGLFGHISVNSSSDIIGVKNLGVVGKINVTNTSQADTFVGGIAGSSNGRTIENCYNQMEINVFTYGKANVGGIVGGFNHHSISRCYNAGPISVSLGPDNLAYVGGIAGEVYTFYEAGSISDCFNTGQIVLEASKRWSSRVGGIVGFLIEGYIRTSYNSGQLPVFTTDVYDYRKSAGIAYATSGKEKVTNAYYLSDTKSGSWGTALTDAQMRQKTNFVGFDFDAVWEMPTNGGYPVLRKTIGTVTPTTYALTVMNGTGGGNYTAGQTVTITANAAPSGKVFDKWTGAAVASATSPTTTLTMPANNVTVTATYKNNDAATISDGLYAIVGKASGKAITTGIADENGKECFILTYSPKDYTDQVFRFEKQPDGSYVIISNYDGRYLEVQGASLENGAPVQVWQNNGQSNIYWNIYEAGNGYYTIVNRNSGKALDIFWGYTADYSVVDQWERNGTDAQLFRLEPVGGGGTVDPPGGNLEDKRLSFLSPVKSDFDFGKAPQVFVNVKYGDSLFSKPATEYNYDLALVSSVLAASASRWTNPKYLAAENLEELGFKRSLIVKKNYDIANSKDNLKHIAAHTFGCKEITVGGQKYNLVAIVVRGTEGADWYSNMDVGTGTDHLGFKAAADELYNNLFDYLYMDSTSRNIDHTLPTKFLITGHSRGAAVANLMAARLTNITDTGNWAYAGKNNIYAYTFATPNVTKNPAANMSNADAYSNIFNHVNAEDMVPRMPLASWGFGRYGKTLMMNSGDMNPAFAGDKFRNLTGKGYDRWEDGGSAVDAFVNDVEWRAKNVDEYYKKNHNLYPADLLSQKTPYQFMYMLAGTMAGDGTKSEIDNILLAAAMMLDRENSYLVALVPGLLQYSILAAIFPAGYAPLMRFLAGNSGQLPNFLLGGTNRIAYAHATETYISWLQAYGPDVRNNAVDENNWILKMHKKLVEVHCPVDLEIYDTNNRLVGKVVDNEVVEGSIKGIAISVDGDKKNIVLPSDQKYTIKLAATDNGTMRYAVKSIAPLSCESLDSKSFDNVSLTPGKTMTSAVNGEPAESDTKLLVTDPSDTPIREVLPNGTEQSYTSDSKWWQALPNFLQLILRYLLFGWLWMH